MRLKHAPQRKDFERLSAIKLINVYTLAEQKKCTGSNSKSVVKVRNLGLV